MLTAEDINKVTLSARKQLHAWRGDIAAGHRNILGAVLLERDILICLIDEAPARKHGVIHKLIDDYDGLVSMLTH